MRPGKIRDHWVDRPCYPPNKRRGGNLPRKLMDPRDPTILWTEDDQAWAVGEGLFIARSWQTERVILVTLSNKLGFLDITDPEKRQLAMLEHIQRRVLWCDPMYDKLLWFIEQQDREGYYHAWMPHIRERDPELVWYKRWYARKRAAHGVHTIYYGERIERERERRRKISEAAKRPKPGLGCPASALAPATVAFLQRSQALAAGELLQRQEERSRREAKDRELAERDAVFRRKEANKRYYEKRKQAMARARALGQAR